MSLVRIGQIVFGVPLFVFGVMHFLAGGDMAGMVPGWLPGALFWVYLTGLALMAAAVALFLGRYVFPAGVGLAVLVGSFVLTIHLPGMMDPETAQMAMTNGLKDVAIVGAALMAAGSVRFLAPGA